MKRSTVIINSILNCNALELNLFTNGKGFDNFVINISFRSSTDRWQTNRHEHATIHLNNNNGGNNYTHYWLIQFYSKREYSNSLLRIYANNTHTLRLVPSTPYSLVPSGVHNLKRFVTVYFLAKSFFMVFLWTNFFFLIFYECCSKEKFFISGIGNLSYTDGPSSHSVSGNEKTSTVSDSVTSCCNNFESSLS